jgi:spore maturation protein A
MMNKVFGGMIIIAIIFGLVSGRSAQVGEAAFTGANSAIELILNIIGVMSLWCGIMKILEKSGLSGKLSRFMAPITGFLFPDIPKNSTAMEAITMNLTANFLGLSNAATPLGIHAMEELERQNSKKGVASRSMSMLVVLNTASLQIVPSTVLALRMADHSTDPFEIMLPTLCASFVAILCGVMAAKFLHHLAGEKK